MGTITKKEGLPVKQGLTKLLSWLSKQGIAMAVASGSSVESIERHLEQTGLRPYFTGVFSSQDLENGKPEPDFFGYRINFQGLSEPDEFYRVDYSRQPLPEEGDFRRTLYWNPGLTTDETGKAKVTFYNNSFSTSFAVSAEGVTSNGFITTEGCQ